MTDSIRRVILATIVLVAIMVTGTIGYITIEGLKLLDALWMTIITMSTVGFAEATPLDAPGRILTMGIIISTLLVGGYALGNISAFLIGGEIGNILRGRRLERNIERLSQHTILVGYGRVGREAVSNWQDPQLVIIERDPTIATEARELGFHVVVGDATHDAVLHKAGIERATSLMIATGGVADNVLIALTARELNPHLFIAARGDEPGSDSKLRRAGADRVVLPNESGGRRLAAFLKQPAVVDFLDLVMHGDELSLRLQEVQVSDTCRLVGKTLEESKIRRESGGALVMSVRRRDGEHIVAPSSDFRLEAGDLLIILGTDEALEKVRRMVE